MKTTAAGILALALAASAANAEPSPCKIQPVVYEGWQAQQVSNDWVQLTFVPQLGGRLMQVTFNGHPYLFVNPVYKGKYISPAEAAGRWIQSVELWSRDDYPSIERYDFAAWSR